MFPFFWIFAWPLWLRDQHTGAASQYRVRNPNPYHWNLCSGGSQPPCKKSDSPESFPLPWKRSDTAQTLASTLINREASGRNEGSTVESTALVSIRWRTRILTMWIHLKNTTYIWRTIWATTTKATLPMQQSKLSMWFLQQFLSHEIMRWRWDQI